MAQYRVLDPNEAVIDTKEFANASDAYDWFNTVEVPSDKLGYRMEVQHDDGEWHMFDQTDGTQSKN
jgi:hypothetical protein